jgi:lipoprotein-anchoring transpeptidase ErfK/SrfK
VEWDTGKKIWERLIGEPATFGCAMLDDRDAAVLFEMAYIGMPVHVIH